MHAEDHLYFVYFYGPVSDESDRVIKFAIWKVSETNFILQTQKSIELKSRQLSLTVMIRKKLFKKQFYSV